ASTRTPPGPVAAGEIRFVQADVRVPEDVDRLVSGFARLDVVVNNAGGSPYAPLDGTSPRLHARVIDLNLTAPLLVAQRAYPLLAASCGAIVMIGSVSGSRPSPGTAAYGAAKAGLHHLARCLAAEWAPRVRVNTIVVGLAATTGATPHYEPHQGGTGSTAGGHVLVRGAGPTGTAPAVGGDQEVGETGAGELETGETGAGGMEVGGMETGDPEAGEMGTGRIGATIPAGRMATPGDVAQVCLWLAAPGYVTGAEVRVDGGGETPAWRHLAEGSTSPNPVEPAAEARPAPR
ncbi:SDR family oxidoreductase, partial [Nonomuraea diastatica]|uniref:SDR family oxidoreductase n=1 Tax=Nonomuraea diastatica TaxID=1848329 RepID=UPI0024829801